MALTNQGVKVSLPNTLVPSGFATPALSEFSDHEYKRTMVLNVPKATVQNAAKETTLTNIIDDVAVGIKKQVDDIMTADYIASNTVDYWIDFTSISSNIAPSLSSDFFGDAAVNYVCVVDVYIKTA